MSSSAARNDLSERAIHSNWILSFGDLLTLLLCFFLSIISFSPLNPANNVPVIVEEDQPVEQVSTNVLPDAPTGSEPGTALANLTSSDAELTPERNRSYFSGLRFWLNESDYSGLGWEPSEEAAKRIKNQVVRTSYQPKRVTIESCFDAGVKGAETVWAGSISRILNLRSQLIDAGLPSGSFEYRVLGPHCNGLRTQETQDPVEAKTAVSRITIEFEMNHG
jgi:flagellar motor protein MotB